MRDKEFLAAMNKMAPILSKKFHFLARRANVSDDRKSFVEDLVALTNLEALLNSRKEIHMDITCEKLIRIKAKNVWADYCRQRFTTFNHSNHEELQLDWNEGNLPKEASGAINEKIEWLLENADEKSVDIINKRLQGYEVNEIAAMYGSSEGSITMHIQRLKKKIEKRP